MIDYNDSVVRAHMYEGLTGLELESHRVDRYGQLALTPHPFPGDKYIDRDFGEAQIEISASVADTSEGALGIMHSHLVRLHERLEEKGELLWPFSNPPVIVSEDSIRIADYSREQRSSYDYRVYLSEKYGKYKMTYSGIHYNFSFGDAIIERGAKMAGLPVREFRDRMYLDIAERSLELSWVPVALLAASPVADGSLFDEAHQYETMFTGFATLRCSDFGYWNPFVPTISYVDIDSYIESMQKYVKRGLLVEARELYYPVRIKPTGKYTLQGLRESGVDHIELRMVDVNPYAPDGIDIRDLRFLHLFMIWLSSLPERHLGENEQMTAIYNHKAAASYSWTIPKITLPGIHYKDLESSLRDVLTEMARLFEGDEQAMADIAYQMSKVDDPGSRYSHRVLKDHGTSYIETGLKRAREIQAEFLREASNK